MERVAIIEVQNRLNRSIFNKIYFSSDYKYDLLIRKKRMRFKTFLSFAYNDKMFT